ncbi:four and a half LIM domains protein limpet isoform X1 [Musca autumnalis]|uniref:four and a half LIM domains protein limpet isoform X1 n=1 Tax=Musca autumnalis TaxID=221902 RepID=UPI003CE9193F
MGDLLSDFGDLMFTLVIGYIGAVEFLYVVRHLYHWSSNHDGTDSVSDTDNLAGLQESMREQLAAAKATEEAAGKKAMKDGVLYEDGFRIDPNQADIDNLKQQLNQKAERDMRRADLEKELDKQKQIAEQTRKELQEAEAEVARQQKREAEENERKLREAELQREREQKRREEEEEAKRLAEERERKQKEAEEEEKRKQAEEEKRKQAEEEQKRKQAEEEEEKRKQAAEEEKRRKAKEEDEARQRQEEEEQNARLLLEAERLKEEQQRQAEEQAEQEENEKRLLEAERQMEEDQRIAEQMLDSDHGEELTDNERQLIASIKERGIAEQHDEASAEKEAELLQRILKAREQLGEESEEEQSQGLFSREQDRELKQKRIEENARLFLEAEKEMADLQELMLEAVQKKEFATSLDSAPQTPAIEEPCIKKTVYPLEDDTPVSHRVKTQLAQNSDDSYSISTKSLLFPGISDDASSNDPPSSKQSSFSTQASDEVTTSNESQYLQQERQEPDGEDTTISQQYSDDYLRSLDGIKSRPLSREDRSGRRIAFKKRRSSGSSNSSRDSRTSRDEELKMFTSLEEEEMKTTGDSEFTPIRYTGEPTLKVKGHHRRHKRSPAKDMRSGDDSLRSSLERLGEETINPWGDVVPEHYKDTEFWKREKAISIEEERDFEKPTSSEELNYDTATNLPSASSFEEATQIQNEEALNNLRKQENKEEEESATKEDTARSDNNANLQTSPTAEKEASPSRSSASPGLRRSPRIEEMQQYEERWKESNEPSPSSGQGSVVNTPIITVDKPLDFGTWRDEHGLIMEGLSDFYDFTASVNPSRSRSTSRNPSPSNTAPSTPEPKNVSCEMNSMINSAIDVYDDTGEVNLNSNEFSKENIGKFLDSLNGVNGNSLEMESSLNTEEECQISQNSMQSHLEYVADDQPRVRDGHFALPLVNVIDDNSHQDEAEPNRFFENNNNDDGMNNLVANLRAQRSRSRSRSKSPLPTSENIQRSLETRRHKMIKHNEDVLEKLIESKLLPDSPEQDIEIEVENFTKETTSIVAETLRSERSGSHSSSLGEDLQSHHSQSRSRSKSPLPTPDNIKRSLETRRSKLIQHNEEVFDKLVESNLMPLTTEKEESASDDDDCNPESVRLLVESLRAERSRSRSRSCCESPEREVPNSAELNEKFSQQMQQSTGNVPPFTAPLVSIEIEASASQAVDDYSRESVSLLVESLRAERSRSRSRCRSPIPTTEHIEQRLKDNEGLNEKFSQQMQSSEMAAAFTAPLVSIEVTEPDVESPETTKKEDEEECSREQMDSLVQSLRVARSRSRSKSPMRLPTAANLNKSLESRRSKLIEINDNIKQDLEEQARTAEQSQLTVEYVYEFVENSEESSESAKRCRLSRSRTPSRSPEATDGTPFSRNPSRSVSPSQDSDFHVMLNLEGSSNRTLTKNTEVFETTLAQRQKKLDEEALERMKNASEEIELRTLSPLNLSPKESKEDEAEENRDFLASLPMAERHKLMRKSPTTPDYDRTISEEMRDVDRIKQEMVQQGFKRSTYVGESMDLVGTEYESMRREAERFRRSCSPTPSFSESPVEPGQMNAAERRHIQDLVLAELTGASEVRSTGAIPKIQASVEASSTETSVEEMRRRNAEFQRSASKSRSPLGEAELADLAGIEAESAKRTLKDNALDEICNINFQEFSRHLNPHYLDEDRRASDSALITNPDILIQFQGSDFLDPEEYHHFRRFSLAQEQQVEEYPSDDFIFIQQVEVRTRSGSRTWTKEDFYSGDLSEYVKMESEEDLDTEASVDEAEGGGEEDYLQIDEESEVDVDMDIVEAEAEENDNSEVADELIEPYEADGDDDDDEEEESNGSDDRRTVIEVDDEIDEDISDFNERGPAEESHHEQSECEEAEREMDRYAGREARDWDQVVTQEQDDSEGAVGGGASSSPYDSDSFAIDQIYDEAIRNRKQSGILREFDSLLNEMSSSSIENSVRDMEEQYALWSKTHKKSKNIEFSSSFIESERKDTEIRYLGDANVTARQSTRLRSRYGYNPVLQASTIPDDIEVDLNYKPKKEYNWRKNFRLSDEELHEANERLKNNENTEDSEPQDQCNDENQETKELQNGSMDMRRYSLGGESVTLFSQSPERLPPPQEEEEFNLTQNSVENENEMSYRPEDVVVEEEVEKPKKKKTKKKSRKGSKGTVDILSRLDDDNDDYESPIYSRRSSSIQMETDSPKRKSRSRRSSKSSVTNDDSFGLYSPRSSVGYADPITDIIEEYSEVTVRPKKIKKRKKAKETLNDVSEITREEMVNGADPEPIQDSSLDTVSAIITPDSASANVLSMLSPQESICVTPASLDSEISVDSNQTTNSSNSTANSTTAATSVSSPVDSFDILKDANFYPLF